VGEGGLAHDLDSVDPRDEDARDDAEDRHRGEVEYAEAQTFPVGRAGGRLRVGPGPTHKSLRAA
jgi:hypothetical protein